MTNNEKVRFIIESLEKNKSRDEIAKELGYSTYKSMDIFLNRQGYRWNRSAKNYFKEEVGSFKNCDLENQRYNSAAGDLNSHNSRAEYIVDLISKEKYDLKTVAKTAKFKDYKEMALFMKSKGYMWNDELNNYVFKGYENLEQSTEENISEKEKITITPVSSNTRTLRDKIDLEKLRNAVTSKQPKETCKELNLDDVENSLSLKKYLSILKFLEDNKECLYKLFEQQSLSGRKLPRYRIQGAFITKSIHMNNVLNQMVRNYSEENNISQREIFEVALIEFFKKYGYSREVETFLGGDE